MMCQVSKVCTSKYTCLDKGGQNERPWTEPDHFDNKLKIALSMLILEKIVYHTLLSPIVREDVVGMGLSGGGVVCGDKTKPDNGKYSVNERSYRLVWR